jgi:hypothetical protein
VSRRRALRLDDLDPAQRAAVEAQLGRAPVVVAPPAEVVEPEAPGGPRFRSRTEARFAAWCDAGGWTWRHEPLVLRLPTARGRYVPDFACREVVGATRLVEVKGARDGRPYYRQRDDARRVSLAAWVLAELGLPPLYVAWPSGDGWQWERVEVRR